MSHVRTLKADIQAYKAVKLKEGIHRIPRGSRKHNPVELISWHSIP